MKSCVIIAMTLDMSSRTARQYCATHVGNLGTSRGAAEQVKTLRGQGDPTMTRTCRLGRKGRHYETRLHGMVYVQWMVMGTTIDYPCMTRRTR